MDNILIIGAGGHAKSCIDVIERQAKYNILGLVEKASSKINTCLGYPVIGSNENLVELRKKCNNSIIGIGQIKTANKRVDDILKKLNKTTVSKREIYVIHLFYGSWHECRKPDAKAMASVRALEDFLK